VMRLEVSEPNQLHLATGCNRGLDGFQQGIKGIGRIGSGLPGFIGDGVYQFGFVHRDGPCRCLNDRRGVWLAIIAPDKRRRMDWQDG